MTLPTETQAAIAAILSGLHSAEPENAFVMVRIDRHNVGNVMIVVPEGADSTAILAATLGILDDELNERLDGAT